MNLKWEQLNAAASAAVNYVTSMNGKGTHFSDLPQIQQRYWRGIVKSAAPHLQDIEGILAPMTTEERQEIQRRDPPGWYERVSIIDAFLKQRREGLLGITDPQRTKVLAELRALVNGAVTFEDAANHIITELTAK
jgi:hypothetical protein